VVVGVPDTVVVDVIVGVVAAVDASFVVEEDVTVVVTLEVPELVLSDVVIEDVTEVETVELAEVITDVDAVDVGVVIAHPCRVPSSTDSIRIFMSVAIRWQLFDAIKKPDTSQWMKLSLPNKPDAA